MVYQRARLQEAAHLACTKNFAATPQPKNTRIMINLNSILQNSGSKKINTFFGSKTAESMKSLETNYSAKKIDYVTKFTALGVVPPQISNQRGGE
jgi:hypothetical protein